MFEFLFKYPRTVFTKGTFVFLGGWPNWVLWLGLALVAVALGLMIRRRASGSPRVAGLRPVAVWLLQTLLAAVLLLMLWHPALSIATLRPQQNIVAVVVDDSASMAVEDVPGTVSSSSRRAAAVRVLDSGLISSLP